MFGLPKILSKYKKTKAEAEQKRLVVRGEVLSLIVSEVTGRSQLTEENEEAQIIQAIQDGIISEAEAAEAHEVATAGFKYLKAGEAPEIDPEPLMEARAKLLERHRSELIEASQAIVTAQENNAAKYEARAHFQQLAREYPEIAQELTRQCSVSWKPKVAKPSDLIAKAKPNAAPMTTSERDA